MGKGKKYTEKITFTVTLKELETLEKIANEKGLSLSALIRTIIRDWLKRFSKEIWKTIEEKVCE